MAQGLDMGLWTWGQRQQAIGHSNHGEMVREQEANRLDTLGLQLMGRGFGDMEAKRQRTWEHGNNGNGFYCIGIEKGGTGTTCTDAGKQFPFEEHCF